MLVFRVDANGKFRDSKPCVNCTNKLKQTELKFIIYSNADGEFEINRVKNLTTTHYSIYDRKIKNV